MVVVVVVVVVVEATRSCNKQYSLAVTSFVGQPYAKRPDRAFVSVWVLPIPPRAEPNMLTSSIPSPAARGMHQPASGKPQAITRIYFGGCRLRPDLQSLGYLWQECLEGGWRAVLHLFCHHY
ncbi:hypothetical protein E2C01_011191 [Portunus trituberculatus]|uniref:Uncharacterized protein n=1 Tax=Portunus trituberculatus TaxID=210409 RepID=A0A5B7DAR3_PORTR|nr:hypothetical protein [Portunus trituberculatus]